MFFGCLALIGQTLVWSSSAPPPLTDLFQRRSLRIILLHTSWSCAVLVGWQHPCAPTFVCLKLGFRLLWSLWRNRSRFDLLLPRSVLSCCQVHDRSWLVKRLPIGNQLWVRICESTFTSGKPEYIGGNQALLGTPQSGSMTLCKDHLRAAVWANSAGWAFCVLNSQVTNLYLQMSMVGRTRAPWVLTFAVPLSVVCHALWRQPGVANRLV